jgi:hypothetical protein
MSEPPCPKCRVEMDVRWTGKRTRLVLPKMPVPDAGGLRASQGGDGEPASR